tara:strand:- start:36 stop:218 length:183 start_codon:yes stop_codon:yes gene_type:complete
MMFETKMRRRELTSGLITVSFGRDSLHVKEFAVRDTLAEKPNGFEISVLKLVQKSADRFL